MELEILSIYDRADLPHERIVLLAADDCNLWPYIIFNSKDASDLHRFSFIFPNQEINKGDTITLYTKEGVSQIQKNSNSTRNYIFYWGLKKSIWSNSSDKVLLVKAADYKFKNL